VRRVVVVGSSGAGKTRVARALAEKLDVAHLELDGVFHQAGWTHLPTPQFRARVAEFVAADGWVVDGNYSEVRDLVWRRADTVVWLDLPRWQVMAQLLRRSLGRSLRRRELWNGNRESLRNLVRRDPRVNVVLWSWQHYRAYREEYLAAQNDPANGHLRFVRLTSRRAAAELLETVPRW
jgi:adenylate kinase family enzyme